MPTAMFVGGQALCEAKQAIRFLDEVTRERGVKAVVAGADHACALVGGAVRCWGDDQSGQLRNDSTTQSAVPVQVAPWDL